ncbi:MAG: tyrosine-type recombinase/integrase [Rhodoferax sp.]|nr:tyrosine-type recombinase/integrase [Rhodoferax sp.]
MKNRSSKAGANATTKIRPDGIPDESSLAALRGWYEGLSARQAVTHYLGDKRTPGASSRGVLGEIRGQLIRMAQALHRPDLAAMFVHSVTERVDRARAVRNAIEQLRSAKPPTPTITDPIDLWLPNRSVNALTAHGIRTLADLTVRIPRKRRWWTCISGLGSKGAHQIEVFFAEYPALTRQALASVTRPTALESIDPIASWDRLDQPLELSGSQGAFRAPRSTCILDADNDYQAVQAWLDLHESSATQRAYRKEAERLILWATLERGRSMSSLTTEDALAYRKFLLHPSPRSRWVGPPQPRNLPQWRPFADNLTPRSVAYALSVLGAMFRWLIAQRYLLANPFAGMKVRGATRQTPVDSNRVFTQGEWELVRTIADGLEWSYGWKPAAAQRLRFILDFGYGTGLRASELVGAQLHQIGTDPYGDQWLKVVGKGTKSAKVALPPIATNALQTYLMQRGLPTTPALWKPGVALIGNLVEEDGNVGVTALRLGRILRRFFSGAADVLRNEAPTTADKLMRASTHWMRHSHATHALERGADLTTVRDNLRHASVSTTSIYLHSDDAKRAKQIRSAFTPRRAD